MKHLITILLLPLTLLFAKPIDRDQASNLALNFATLNHKTLILDTHTSHIKRSVHSVHEKDKETPYYFINLKPKGWVLVSGNDVIDPILGFSFDANIDTNTPLPPALISMLDGFESDIDYLESHPIKVRSKTSNMWDELSENPESFRANIEDFRIRHKSFRSSRKKEIKPLLTTNWHQHAPYNAYTPIIAGEHSYVGCVATALAQIMAYHQWPTKGRGKHTHTLDSSLTVNFGATTYNWSNITNNDIAKLSYHIGVASDMYYTKNVSETSLEKAHYALHTHFKYTSSTIEKRSYFLNPSSWDNRLQNNLNQKLPILYGGFRRKGIFSPNLGTIGHAFVCDGYKDIDEKIYYHINYGFKPESNANGYFSLHFFNSDSINYYYKNIAIFDIKPVRNSDFSTFAYSQILPTLLFGILGD